MVMSYLSLDLVEEILSRVPATSLERLRSTCRRWNTLFKDQRFTENHFRNATKESLVLMWKNYRVYLVSGNHNVSPPSIKFKGELGLKDSHSYSEKVDIYEVFHCDGLLLCTTKNDRLVVWNPCLGKTRWIQFNTTYKGNFWFALGYENNKSCRSYKILMCRKCYDFKLNYQGLGFEIYDFSSDSWRVLDYIIPNSFLPTNGVSLKGNTYCHAYYESDILFSFDFTAKIVKHMCLPKFENHGCMTLSDFREEQLLVIHRSYSTSKMEIWVTNKIDAKALSLWSKFFTVDFANNVNYFDISKNLLIDEEKKAALYRNLSFRTWNIEYTIGEDDKFYTEIINPWWPDQRKRRLFIFNYVPSLVQIQ